MLAGKGYAAAGRGSIMLDLDKKYCPSGRGGPSRMYYAEEQIKKLSDPFAILFRLYDYNPEREILFTFFDSVSGKGKVHILGERDDGTPFGTGFPLDESGRPPLAAPVEPVVADMPNSLNIADFNALNKCVTDIVSRRGIEGLNARERVIWDVLELKYQVGNGGFAQFFANCGSDWKRMREALRLAGAEEISAVFARACAVFPEETLNASDDIEDQVESVLEKSPDPWDAADSEFYTLSDKLHEILWKFWTREKR